MYAVESRWIITSGMGLKAYHSLIIDGKTILDILPWDDARERYPDAKIIDRHDCVISPGFVNAHMHLYGVLAHGIEPPFVIEDFKSFLEDYWWPLVENRLDVPMIRAASAYTAAELANSGVTALCDVLEAPNTGIEGLEAEADVINNLGMRAILSSEACERISTERGYEILEENGEFCRRYRDDELISGMVCTHTAFTCSEDFMREALRIASVHDSGLQFHLNESSYEPDWVLKEHGMRTCSWYDEIGILSDQVLAAQGVQLSGEEIEILAKQQVRMVHVPLSNCEVGGGVSPVPDLLEAGITCGLGTDGYINNFFAVMRAAFLFHKGHRCDPSLMSGKTVYRMATEDGADVLYPRKQMNRLQNGNAADFITISLESLPTEVTEKNLFDQLILYRDPQHVEDVCVAGRWIKQDSCMNDSDNKKLRDEAYEQSLRLWELVSEGGR